MRGQEDFGPLLDVLLGCVGVLDFVSLIALAISPPRATKKLPVDVNNNDVTSLTHEKIPITGGGGSSKAIPMLVVDGMIKEDDVIDSLVSKVNELEAKVIELEVRSREASMERFLDTERYRRSRSPSPYSTHHDYDNDEDDESRRTIKRSSKASSVHETREEELARLTELETEEMSDMSNFVPIVYSTHVEGDDDAPRIADMSEEEQTIAAQPIDINENFIAMEKQQSHATTSKVLTKQAHVESVDSPPEEASPPRVEVENASREMIEEIRVEIEEKMNAITIYSNSAEPPRVEQQSNAIKIDFGHLLLENSPKLEEVSIIPPIEHEIAVEAIENALKSANIETPETVLKSPASESNDDFIIEKIEEIPAKDVKQQQQQQSIQVFDESALSSSLGKNEGVSIPSTAMENDYAVRSTTPEPHVSILSSTSDFVNHREEDANIEKELLNIVGSPSSSSGEGLKRIKSCINSLDRSASRSSSRLSRRSRKSKSPSVASEEDYKEWFDKFDNHLSAELTLAENDDSDFGSDIDDEEQLLMVADNGNLDGTEICNIDDGRDVSVSVTLNLATKKPCHPCDEFIKQEKNAYKTRAEELEEMQQLRETTKGRRLSILPSTEEQQHNYVSILHPEEFPSKAHEVPPHHHEHHQHLHNVGYGEWMKKIVDHHSSHLALSDSDSDSDVPLDDVQMLPLFCDEKLKTSSTSTGSSSNRRKKKRK